MIYRNHRINAEVQTWDVYELNDDGTLGDFMNEGGGDTDYPMYAVWTLDDDGDADEGLGEFDSIELAKKIIDEHINRTDGEQVK